MKRWTITMSCPHCDEYVPITDNDRCIACGQPLTPDYETTERICSICRQVSQMPNDDDPNPVCHDCIVAVVWDGDLGHETLNARLARLGAA